MIDSNKEAKYKYHIGYCFYPGLKTEDIEFEYLNDDDLIGIDIYDHIYAYVKKEKRKIVSICIYFN